jgi:N-carbamoyl-L-amino-acid hydrolase
MPQTLINPDRLHDNLHQLAQIGRTPDGGVSRVAFSDADLDGREFVLGLMRDAGLSVRVDTVGNVFGRRDGEYHSGSPILLGSHVDTVPNGGAFDGALGVLAGIEVAQTLAESDYECRFPIEVVAWSDEEGGLSGSRGYVGDLRTADLEAVVAAGMTLDEGIRRIGGDPDRISESRRSGSDLSAYLELHVEQGGRLEAEGLDIGVVTGIVGIRHYGVTFTGTSNHAGTTPMDQRKNALLGGCEFVLAVDGVVRSVEGTHVGTVGELTVHPGAPNVIPGKVHLTVELRDLEITKIESLWEMLEVKLQECSAKFWVSVDTVITHAIDGVATHPDIQSSIVTSATDLGLSYCRLPSGAGHDAQNLARITPTGMIFVPSVGGVSHSAAEFTNPEDVVNGTQVLLNSVLHLDLVGAPRA